MKTFISLIKMTGKGRNEIAESLHRGEIVQDIMKPRNVAMRDYFFTFGAYDFVMIFEAPSEQTMAQVLVEINRLGAIETNTMLALCREDYTEVLDGLGPRP